MDFTVLKYKDENGQWVPFANTAMATNDAIKVKEVVTGTIDGLNKDFFTVQPYIGGTLQVYVNGLAQSGFVTEVNPATGQFSLSEAPTGDVRAYYHIGSLALGNAESVGGYQLSGILEALYPVGAVFVSGSDTLPALVASIGTWQRIEGRFIIGANSDYPVNTVGGSSTHLHEIASPIAFNTKRGWAYNDASFEARVNETGGSVTSKAIGNVGYTTGGNTTTGNMEKWKYTTGPASNIPPYKAKYMWERIS